jgi:hypothetical protein
MGQVLRDVIARIVPMEWLSEATNDPSTRVAKEKDKRLNRFSLDDTQAREALS